MKINPYFSVQQLRKQLEQVQEVNDQPAEAAMSFDSIFPADRSIAAQRIANDPIPNWNDFLQLKNALHKEWNAFTGNPGTVGSIIWAMSEVSKKIDPSKVPVGVYDIFGNKLMMVAEGRYTAGQFNRALSDAEVQNAAFTFCKFIERAGHRITNQDSLIEKLLSINHSRVRDQVARLLSKTTNLTWRKNPYNAGVIKAIRVEHDNNIRNKLVQGLANNRPDCLLKEYSISGYGKCTLIFHIQSDSLSETEINASYWVYHALKAESKEGEYYSRFSEKPAFSENEIANAFKYGVKTIERYESKANLTANDLLILQNGCAILTQVLNLSTSQQTDPSNQGVISKEIRSLSQKDLSKAIEVLLKRETGLATVETILPVLLKYRLFAESYPLEYLDNLKIDLGKQCKMLNASDIERLHKVIGSGVIAYLNENNQRQNRFSSVDNFNRSASMLLSELSTKGLAVDVTLQPKPKFSRSDSERLTILKELNNMNKAGIVISTGPKSIFSSAISKTTRDLLITSLMTNAHAGDVLPELINPTSNTSSGAALILLRSLTPSFKDYYGGRAIKDLGVKFAQGALSLKGHREKVGLLLSGPKGTGKSLFGQVLANEIGLPLITITGAEIKDGQIYYSSNKQYYPIADFFKKLTNGGKAVLLMDEVESLVSNTNPTLAVQILDGLDLIRSTNSPIVVIGTTNCPGLKTAKKAKIAENGKSPELDKELKSFIDARAISKFELCYLFHLPIAGSEYGLDYIKQLRSRGCVVGEVSDAEIIKLCKGLSAGTLSSRIDRLLRESSQSIPSSSLFQELKTLKLDSEGIQSLAKSISAKLTSSFAQRGIDEDVKIDYPEVALMVQDLPILEISRKLDSITEIVNQQKLIEILLS